MRLKSMSDAWEKSTMMVVTKVLRSFSAKPRLHTAFMGKSTGRAERSRTSLFLIHTSNGSLSHQNEDAVLTAHIVHP